MNDTTTNRAGDYRLISCDSHFNEPPDLWTRRVPTEFRDRVPRIESFDEGDAWVIEGVRDPINFGMNACAGLDPKEMSGWARFEDLRRGGYDPAARLAEMDVDGVDAEVMYPTPRLSNAIVATKDADLHTAMVRAYNDWVSEYVEYAPERFGGLALMPNRGVEGAVSELERVIDRPGMRGAMIGCWPNGTLSLTSEDDKLFAALSERGLTLNIHVAMTQSMPAAHRAKLPGYGRFFDAPNRMIEMIFEGVFDRYPELNVVFAEVDFGWVPYVKEQIDNNYSRLDPLSQFGLQRLPSEYISDHFHFGYMTDTFGLRNLAYMGAERVMWSSDYPHISADYPTSWRVIQASMSGISAADKQLILAGNAQRLYKFS
ncbi:MAG TPA: amidohydrolase family protein [Ilumatobacteraceae bacterium]|nr:amidohydrolase family protein [Ilumatobacteraceae bacterium]